MTHRFLRSNAIFLVASIGLMQTAMAQVDMLPDMVPWVSNASNYQYEGRLNSSLTEARFTTAPLNIGTGHLTVQNTGRTDETGTMQIVEQVIQIDSNDDGIADDYRVRDAGFNIFHPTHNHIHFDHYAQQRIRAVTADNGIGEILAEGQKISFCLIDLDNFSSPNSSIYNSCGGSTDTNNDGELEWGISAGWADIYSSGLDGQEINISSLPRTSGQFDNGLVWLEVEIDVDNQMLESDETNNIAHILIDLNNRTSSTRTLRVIDDHVDSTTGSTLIHADASAYRYGVINSNGDTDMFRFEAQAGATYEVFYRELQLETGGLTLFDTDGTSELFQLDASADNYQTLSMQFTAENDGSYFLAAGEIGTFGSFDDGSYQVWVNTISLPPVVLDGDYNLDGVVDAADYSVWRDTMGSETELAADGDGSGMVDAADYDMWRANFGATLETEAALSAGNVPEPSTIVLAISASALLLVRRRYS